MWVPVAPIESEGWGSPDPLLTRVFDDAMFDDATGLALRRRPHTRVEQRGDSPPTVRSRDRYPPRSRGSPSRMPARSIRGTGLGALAHDPRPSQQRDRSS